MKKYQIQPIEEVEFVEYFRSEEKAKRHIETLTDEGRRCNLFNTSLGYFVCTLTAMASQ